MARDPEQQVFKTAGGFGVLLFAGALVLIPAFFPAYALYKLVILTGVTSLHPAIVIALAAAAGWAAWRLGGMLIRSMPPGIARSAIAGYIGACYTFAFFQRELTTARPELDLPWLMLGFAIFTFIGWKIGGVLVLKAHRDRLIRVRRKEQDAA
ncbi:MAG TPA: hypothetical protein VF548_01470 [Allosphingosinicella sp.]|jgi:hypothetical protein